MTSTPFTTLLAQHAADPATTITTPTVVAVLDDGGAALSAGPFEWHSDLPPALGGTGSSPSPTAYLLGALAGCAVAYVARTLAPEFDVEFDRLAATARCRSDIAALVGAPDTAANLDDLTLEISYASGSDPARIGRLEAAWRARCPVLLSLVNPQQVRVDFVQAEGQLVC